MDRGLQGTGVSLANHNPNNVNYTHEALNTSVVGNCRSFIMLLSSAILSIAVAAALTLPPLAAASEYHEQLTLRPLPPSSLLASFDFRANTTTEAFEQQNFRYFPRSLGQILQAANTKELHLRFSLGRWDAEEWGARPHRGRQEGGTGVEIWAWVEALDDEEYDLYLYPI